jgi:uncharacterized protein YqjF (DUF2071 family)
VSAAIAGGAPWRPSPLRLDGLAARQGTPRWPGSRGPGCHAEVEIGAALDATEEDELTHFLTARYRLFTVVAGRLVAAEVQHPPWPLHHAEVVALDQDLVQSAGLAVPDERPLVHASPGVPVRVGMWHP